MQNDGILELVSRYESYLLHKEKPLAQQSIRAYRADVEWLLERFEIKDHLDITDLESEEIQSELGRFKVSTQARRIFGLKAFFKFLSIKEGIKCDHFNFKKPGTEDTLPVFISNDVYQRMREYKFKVSGNNPRNLALFDVIYGSGLKLSTTANMQLRNIYLEKMQLTGLEGYVCDVPLSRESHDSLNDYLISYQDPTPESQLFPSKREGVEKFGIRAMRNVINKFGKSMGIEISPGDLRWSFFVNLMDKNTSLEEALNFMGRSYENHVSRQAVKYRLKTKLARFREYQQEQKQLLI